MNNKREEPKNKINFTNAGIKFKVLMATPQQKRDMVKRLNDFINSPDEEEYGT